MDNVSLIRIEAGDLNDARSVLTTFVDQVGINLKCGNLRFSQLDFSLHDCILIVCSTRNVLRFKIWKKTMSLIVCGQLYSNYYQIHEMKVFMNYV